MLSYKQYAKRVRSLYIENESVSELENIVEIKGQLDHFYLTEKDNLSFNILNKRRKKLKTQQLFEATNYLSLFIGMVASIAASEIIGFTAFPTIPTFFSKIVLSIVFIIILFHFFIQTSSTLFLTNRREYCEPYELELIDTTIKCLEDELRNSKATKFTGSD